MVGVEQRAQIWERFSGLKVIKFSAQLFRAVHEGGRGIYVNPFAIRRLDKMETNMGR